MRSARRRTGVQVRSSVPSTKPTVVTKSVKEPIKKDRHVTKMEEEQEPISKHNKHVKKHSVDEMDSESDDNDSSDDVQMNIEPEKEHEELRQEVASQTLSKLRPNEDLYIAIKERYQELIKELWQSQNALEEFEFSEEEKQILRDRVKLWLEYFISTATFRDENVNLFEYMDTFWEKEHFI